MEAQEGQNWPPVGGRRAPGWADPEAEEEERKIRKKKEKKAGEQKGERTMKKEVSHLVTATFVQWPN